MWLFEIKWLKLKFNEADHTQTETEVTEWVVGPDLPTVYNKTKIQVECREDQEWVSIRRTVPVIAVINREE
jgi:hypothetical protein